MFYYSHQCNSTNTVHVRTTQKINSKTDPRNTTDTEHLASTKGDEFSDQDKNVTGDNASNGINNEDNKEGDIQLIVPNYTGNTQGMFIRNVNVHVKHCS